MQRRILVLLIVGFLLIGQFSTPADAKSGSSLRQSLGGEVICLPDSYLQEPENCLPLGPSGRLTEMAKSGFTFPALPMPVKKTAPDLANVPYLYALAYKTAVPAYSSIADAAGHNERRFLPAGRKYLSYSQRVVNDQGTFYRIQTGEWVTGESIESRISASTVYRGVQVIQTPRLSFGWVIDQQESWTAPGLEGKRTGKKYGRFSMVWIYAVKEASGAAWVQIGENEWLEDRVVGRIMPAQEVPAGVKSDRWIEVNLGEQTLSVYEQGKLVFATLISSGNKPFYTRPGTFQIYKKLDAEQMSGAFEADRSDYYYLENVPWTMYFDEARALHGVYWHTLFGYAASHGCVNLALADAHWLYDWAKMGDWVYVWDPTGKTPLDVKSSGGP